MQAQYDVDVGGPEMYLANHVIVEENNVKEKVIMGFKRVACSSYQANTSQARHAHASCSRFLFTVS